MFFGQRSPTFFSPESYFDKIKIDTSYSSFITFILMLYFDTTSKGLFFSNVHKISVTTAQIFDQNVPNIKSFESGLFLFLDTVLFVVYFTLLNRYKNALKTKHFHY